MVPGIRACLKESIDTKRNAVGVVDVITAEDVGKFPDKNVAEALQRVPGVVINREFGEGERVNVRGTAADAHPHPAQRPRLATADWFILDQLNTTRSFNYLMLPADIIGKVDVYKSPQADIEEGGIGGTIDVGTRNPARPRSVYRVASVQAGYTEISDKTDPQATGLFSWQNDPDHRFGVLLGGDLPEAPHPPRRRRGARLSADVQRRPIRRSCPRSSARRCFSRTASARAATSACSCKPTDQLEFNLTGLLSDFGANNLNENYLAWVTRALGNGGTLTNTTVQGGTAVAGTISSLNNGTSDFGVVYDAIGRFANIDHAQSIDLDSKFAPNEDWSANLRVGYTDATGNTDGQPFVEFGAPAVLDLRSARQGRPRSVSWPTAMA